MDFYDELAEEYDEITGLAGRAAPAGDFVKALLSRYSIASALDAATGMGLYAILLGKAGVQTVGADISQAMLDKARERSAREGVSVEWLRAPMQELAGRVERQFDAVLCMGNSIPHLLEDAELDAALGGFVKLLRPGGVVVLQLLNYGRILARGERIVGINRAAGREYVRFCDFLPGRVRFNILQITWHGERCEHRLQSTLLRPYLAEELRAGLARHGCDSVEVYGGLDFRPFDAAESDTVMLIGRKPK